MGVLEEAKNEFVRTCTEAGLDLNKPVGIRPLSSGDAIGDARDDFVLKKGKEYVIGADVGEGLPSGGGSRADRRRDGRGGRADRQLGARARDVCHHRPGVSCAAPPPPAQHESGP